MWGWTPSLKRIPASEPQRLSILRRPTAACAALIAIAAVAAYSNTFVVPFLFDDTQAIPENPGIRHLWPIWDAIWPQSRDLTVSGRPVANLTLAINYAISGRAVWSYHAVNLLIHILAGLTLFGIVRRTLVLAWGKEQGAGSKGVAGDGRRERGGGESGAGLRSPVSGLPVADATFLAFAVALLWTVHPLQTEAVTYVIQRVESLMGLFYLLTLYCFIRGIRAAGANVGRGLPTPPVLWHALSVLSCLLGMATKEVMATAPVMVLLYDRAFVAGTFRDAWRRRRWLYLSFAATWLLLVGLVGSTGWNRGRTAGFDVGVAPWAYWLTQFEAITRYLALAVWPHPLVFEYGTIWVHRAGEVVGPAVVVIALLALTVWAMFKKPRSGFLGAWFFGILAPTSVVPGAIQMIVEHRMYLPLAAVVTAGVLGLHAVFRRLGADGPRDEETKGPWDQELPAAEGPLVPSSLRPLVSWSFGLFVLTVGVAFGVLTARRNRDYRSELSLWSDTVAKRPDNTRARNGMALALDHAGRTAEAIRQFEEALRLSPGDVEIRDNLGVTLEHSGRVSEAIGQYEAALQLRPDFPEAHSNLGNALLRQGRIDEAIRQYETALRLRPHYAGAEYNLAGALEQAGRTADARRHFERAVQLMPDNAEARNNLGNVLHQLGRTAEAIREYETALRLQPDFARAHHNLAVALEETGRLDGAVREYEAAVRLQPDLAEAQNNLGALLCRTGQVAAGLAHLREAVRLQPDVARTHFNLGVALAQAGHTAEAVEEYREALRRQPSMAEAHNNLGMLLGQSGQLPEAIAELQAALRLQPDNAEAHNNLGTAFLAGGQWDRAIAQYEEVLRLRPNDAAARQNLERARAAAGGDDGGGR